VLDCAIIYTLLITKHSGDVSPANSVTQLLQPPKDLK